MKLTVKKGNVKITHEDGSNYGLKHSDTILKLLAGMVEQIIKITKENNHGK